MISKNNATQSRMPVNLVSIPPTSVENVEPMTLVSDFGITVLEKIGVVN